ncbi:hypothetical protein IAU59_005489 [Kwoniella sp. CBS 9459]
MSTQAQPGERPFRDMHEDELWERLTLTRPSLQSRATSRLTGTSATRTFESQFQLARDELHHRFRKMGEERDEAISEADRTRRERDGARAELNRADERFGRLTGLLPSFRAGTEKCTKRIMEDICEGQVTMLGIPEGDLATKAKRDLLSNSATHQAVKDFVTVFTDDQISKRITNDDRFTDRAFSEGSWIQIWTERADGGTSVGLAKMNIYADIRDANHRRIDDGKITDPDVVAYLEQRTLTGVSGSGGTGSDNGSGTGSRSGASDAFALSGESRATLTELRWSSGRKGSLQKVIEKSSLNG